MKLIYQWQAISGFFLIGYFFTLPVTANFAPFVFGAANIIIGGLFTFTRDLKELDDGQ